jgi:hypothetical protein
MKGPYRRTLCKIAGFGFLVTAVAYGWRAYLVWPGPSVPPAYWWDALSQVGVMLILISGGMLLVSEE